MVTYSVIIQNKKTTESFCKYQPLFMEAINDGRIGVCKWNESGATLDTAVPELAEMTNDKDEWRAIIVRLEDEKCMSEFECDSRNPFDFRANNQRTDKVYENEVPLVKLTHMLGGIPEPEIEFVSEQINEKHKAKRTVYKPVYDEVQMKLYKKLQEKYRFDGKMPSSIVIVSVRMNNNEENTIDEVWLSRKESKSSEFWKKNKYPSICRFIVCDFNQQGPIQKDADEFNFWLSLLLLAINETDSGTLQAYRLYKMSVDVDKELMTYSMQSTVERLKSARRFIEDSIKREISDKIKEELPLPDYRIQIPVSLKLPQNDECQINKKDFGILSQGAITDVAIWEKQKKDAEERLDAAVRSAERTLDQTAEKMRNNYVFTDDEVSELDKYQAEDLSREVNEIYSDIINVQGILPSGDVSDDDEIVNVASNIREFLLGRVVAKSAAIALTISLLLMVFTTIPAWVEYFKNGLGALNTILITTVAELVVISLFAFALLLIQKLKLNGMIKLFNILLKSAFNELTENAGDYSRYMSYIASHSRGNSYLNLSSRKKHIIEHSQFNKYRHVKAINHFLMWIKNWSRAYHLNINYNTHCADDNVVVVDMSVPPNVNLMYTFETGKSYEAVLNNSGTEIESPFDFVTRLNIVREELYDDDENS